MSRAASSDSTRASTVGRRTISKSVAEMVVAVVSLPACVVVLV